MSNRAALGIATLLAMAVGCSTAVPALTPCRLAALQTLPEDPRAITSADLDTLAGKLMACHGADSGAP